MGKVQRVCTVYQPRIRILGERQVAGCVVVGNGAGDFSCGGIGIIRRGDFQDESFRCLFVTVANQVYADYSRYKTRRDFDLPDCLQIVAGAALVSP
jgi:hypothetical protein